MQWKIATYDTLTKEDVYLLLQLRVAVFVLEQNCPYQDVDGLDSVSHHVLGYHEKELQCYSRILPPGKVYENHAAIGRVVVKASARNSGLGSDLMVQSIAACREAYPNHPIKISAQAHLKAFYNALGFVYKNEDYLEDGIPHCAMYFENF